MMFKKFVKIVSLVAVTALACASFAACGKTIDGTKTAITVDGEEISTGSVAFYTRYQQAGYYQSYEMMAGYGYYSLEDGVFDGEYQEGQTFGQYLFDEVVTDLEKMVVISHHAEEYGYTLSDESKQAIAAAAESFVNANKETVSKNGITQSDVEKVLQLYTIRTQMRPLMVADIDRNVTDEEAAQSSMVYARISRTNDSTEMRDEEYDALVLDEANQLLAEVKELEDPTQDAISEAAKAIDDRFLISRITFDEDYEYIDDAVKQAALSVPDNTVFDGIVITDDYYYLVKLEAAFDEEATETEKNSIISDRELERFTELTDEWMAAASIETTDALSQITVNDSEVYSIVTE